LHARHVWLPEAGTSTLFAAAKPCNSGSAPNERVFVPALPSTEHILVERDGRQHVVLRAHGAAIQLTIDGADVTAGPVALTFQVRGLTAVAPACDHLTALRRILRTRSRKTAGPRWTATTLKLRDALVTLDGRMAGASYREIAIVLYGLAYVERNWWTGLKERMRRHFLRGLLLAYGRYRDLLR
jgi:hypothetical protein